MIVCSCASSTVHAGLRVTAMLVCKVESCTVRACLWLQQFLSANLKAVQCRQVKSKVQVLQLTNWHIPGPENNQIPVRIYHPSDAKPRKRGLQILVYFHGGCFFSGDLDTYDDLCRNLGHLSAYIVVSVGYRYDPFMVWNMQTAADDLSECTGAHCGLCHNSGSPCCV